MTTLSIDRTRLAFAGSLILGAVVLAITLSGAPIAVARINTQRHAGLGTTRESLTACQSAETLPRHTSALRLYMFAFTGPRVSVQLLAHGQVIAHGERGAGWTGGSVTVALGPLAGAHQGVTLCFALLLNGDEGVSLSGERTHSALAAQVHGEPLPGRVRVEDLRPGSSSWWSLALAVARRMGLGHAWAGTWIALLAGALMLGVVLISWRVVFRELP